jgi:hypothetical protein
MMIDVVAIARYLNYALAAGSMLVIAATLWISLREEIYW